MLESHRGFIFPGEGDPGIGKSTWAYRNMRFPLWQLCVTLVLRLAYNQPWLAVSNGFVKKYKLKKYFCIKVLHSPEWTNGHFPSNVHNSLLFFFSGFEAKGQMRRPRHQMKCISPQKLQICHLMESGVPAAIAFLVLNSKLLCCLPSKAYADKLQLTFPVTANHDYLSINPLFSV